MALDAQLSDRHRFALGTIQLHIKWLERRTREIEEQVFAAMEPYRREWGLMQTIPGISEICAAMLLTEIGTDMSRFGSRERLSSWAGICPGNNQSAGKKKSGRTRKGNRYVRALLCEAAHCASKTKSQSRGIYRSLAIRPGKKRAIMAVGHKLLEVIYVVIRRKQPYNDPEIDYDVLVVQRNAPRWIRAQKKYGYLAVAATNAEPHSKTAMAPAH